jgi:hypothetical protein
MEHTSVTGLCTWSFVRNNWVLIIRDSKNQFLGTHYEPTCAMQQSKGQFDVDNIVENNAK